jgi:hypothetical protein
MIWALLAKFLLSKPAWVQAIVLGLCTGLFVTAAAEANERDPAISRSALMVFVWGSAAALLYYLGYLAQSRRGGLPSRAAPRWLYVLYAGVWLLGLAAAMRALLGEGGFKVAILAVVPLVLLAPTALYGIRQIGRRPVA